MRAIVHHVQDPEGFAIWQMGRVARETADLPNVKEWASSLVANRARARDDVDALRAIYDAILLRWGYVRESDEWVPGDAKRLLGYVAGIQYNTQKDPRTVSIGTIPANVKGWGDCDDVSTLVAALVRAIGMLPFFRVVRWPGGAHVSVMVQTPRGRWVSMDPVGYPEHPFGWKLDRGSVTYYDLEGRRIADEDPEENEDMAMTTEYSMGGLGCCSQRTQTPILCAAAPHLPPGPRSLAMDPRAVREFSKGNALDGTPAVDQYGQMWTYCANRDLMLPGMGDAASRRRRRRRRRVKRRRAIRRAVQKVGQGIGRGARRALNSPLVRGAVAAAGQAVGIPAPATAAALRAANSLVQRKGRRGIAKNFAVRPRKTAALVARAAPALMGAMSGDDAGGIWMVKQAGHSFPAYPVVAMSGIPGAAYMGDLDVSPAPEPGAFYRVRSGDSLLKVAGQAFKLGSGGARLKAAEMINNAPTNAPLVDPSNTDNLFPGGKIRFSAVWSADPAEAIKGVRGSSFPVIWIPASEGDRPPETPKIDPVEPIEPDPEIEETVPDVPEDVPEIPEVVIPEVTIPPVEPDESDDEVQVLPDTPQTGEEVPDVPEGEDVPMDPIEPIEPEVPETSDDLNQKTGMGVGAIVAIAGAGYLGWRLFSKKGKRR